LGEKNFELPTSNFQLPTFLLFEVQSWTLDVHPKRFNYELPTIMKYDLDERLLDFSCGIIFITEALPNTRAGNHVAGQLLRSGTSPHPNHGEAQAAESGKDFVHKMSICLKELRESLRWLRLIKKVPLVQEPSNLDALLKECDELVRIFVASIKTAKGKF
jgi:four helix bundle protein